ncbi:MAG TPA: amino acid adenylation domain-containing protein [Longimicrobium sp.]|nr:amino acid adenylation domain-containing protein [Longimicrobium sp.]
MDRRNLEDIYPLSPLQQGILFHSVYTGGEVYQEQFPLLLHGELDGGALERAFHALVARHGALRTGFVWEGVPQPLQFVVREARAPFRQLDWTGDPGWRARLDALLEEDYRLKYDLKKPPLARAALARLDERRYVFVLSMYHGVTDGWSFPLLIDELMALYDADRAGVPAALPPAPRYRDYVQWLLGRDAAAAEAYWRRTLAGMTHATPLPLDGGGPAGDHVRCETLDLAPAVMERVHAFTRSQGVTLNTLTQAAWALLLGRHAGERDVTFGATVSGRPPELPGVERAVGLYINAVPVRARLDDAVPVGDWLRALQAQQAESRQYEYSRLVDVHGWSGLPHDERLFQSVMVFENYPLGKPDGDDADGLRLEALSEPDRTGYGLALVCAPLPTGMQLRMSYDQARFTPVAARRIVRGVEAAIRGLVEDAGRPLGSVLTLAEDERATLAAWADGPAFDANPAATLHGAFAAHAARAPHAPAVEDARVRWSYAELDARSRALAARLSDAGVGPGDRVGICMERSAAMVAAMLAVVRAGAAYVPLDPEYPSERLSFMVADSGAAALLVDAGAPAFDAFAGPVLRADADDDPPAGEWEDAAVGAEAAAYLIYTSGSTGRPKGTPVPHRAVLRMAADPLVAPASTDRVAQVTSTSFDPSAYEIWGALAAGAALVVIGRDTVLDPAAFAAALREGGVTRMFLATALFNQVARARPDAFATLRQVIVGGEAVDAAAFRAVLAAGCPELVNGYGPTEATIFATNHAVRATGEIADGVSVPIGRPLAGTRAWVLDDAGRPAPLGAAGELCLGGAALAHGYAGRPVLTAERFVPDPFSAVPGARLYRTGDRARWSEDGVLEYRGRIDTQVKVRGYRVEPGEVEAALTAHPGVRAAAVGARVDASGTRGLVAWVEPASAQGMDPAGLRGWLAGRLPEWMLPAAWVIVDALPITANGKVDRAALPDPDGASRAHAEEYVEPSTDTEGELAELWRQLLGVERVGARDSFFAVGGHSLLAMQLASRLQQHFGAELPLRALFDHPRLAEMAARIDQARDAELAALLAEVEGMSDEEARALAGGEAG